MAGGVVRKHSCRLTLIPLQQRSAGRGQDVPPLPSSGSVARVTSPGKTAGGSLPNSQLVTLTVCSCLLGKPTAPSREKASLSFFAPYTSLLVVSYPVGAPKPAVTIVGLQFLSRLLTHPHYPFCSFLPFFQIPHPPHKVLLTRRTLQSPQFPGRTSYFPSRPCLTHRLLHQS